MWFWRHFLPLSEKLRVKACEPYLLCPGPLDLGEEKGKTLASCNRAGQRERFRDLGHEGPLGLFGPQFFLLAWKSLSFPGLRVIVTCFSESQRSEVVAEVVSVEDKEEVTGHRGQGQ